jgi:hypothetical protein
MFERDDVIGLVREIGIVFREQTIFATAMSPFAYFMAYGRGNISFTHVVCSA